MDGIGEYIISIVCAAGICGALVAFLSNKSAVSAVIRIICGIFLVVTVIGPIKKIAWSDAIKSFEFAKIDGDSAAYAGVVAANSETAVIIKEQLETYILDKAVSMGLDITVDIEMTTDTPPQPETVLISGEISPSKKTMLTEQISRELGIPEERQLWK